MAKRKYYLTTSDNPFNYYTQYEDWLRYDTDYRYHTNELVARVSNSCFGIPEEINEDLDMMAVDDIIAFGLPLVNGDGKEVWHMRCYEPETA